MIKEAKDVDFSTTGREPSEQDFARISEWIRQDKKRAARRPKATATAGTGQAAQQRT